MIDEDEDELEDEAMMTRVNVSLLFPQNINLGGDTVTDTGIQAQTH